MKNAIVFLKPFFQARPNELQYKVSVMRFWRWIGSVYSYFDELPIWLINKIWDAEDEAWEVSERVKKFVDTNLINGKPLIVFDKKLKKWVVNEDSFTDKSPKAIADMKEIYFKTAKKNGDWV